MSDTGSLLVRTLIHEHDNQPCPYQKLISGNWVCQSNAAGSPVLCGNISAERMKECPYRKNNEVME
jgi:hypothetical protein